MIICDILIVFAYLMNAIFVIESEDPYYLLLNLDSLRVLMVFGLLFNMIELFTRIRIFDFFAYFVRQMSEIVEDALPLGAMLAFIVWTQTVLFWVYDQNNYG